MLQTKNLLILPHSVADASVFFSYTKNNEDYLSESFPRTVASTHTLAGLEKHYAKKEENWKEEKEFACGVYLNENKKPVGYISVKNIDWDVPKGEMAYYIFKEYAGRGFATEAMLTFQEWCFSKKKFIRLYAKIIVGNAASIRIVEKCGFQLEGILKKDYRTGDDQLVDLKIYGLTR